MISFQLVLKEIIGLTTKNCNGLASNVSSASCVYVAGCVAVVYNVDSGTQSHLMVSHRKPKPLSCVAVSPDGRFIAAGEVRFVFLLYFFFLPHLSFAYVIPWYLVMLYSVS